MAMDIDRGKAPFAGMTLRRRQDRAVDELVGLCRGVMADGHVSQQEAEFLLGWLQRNAEFVGEWPFQPLYARIGQLLEDGLMDADESADLHDTLSRFIGGEAFDPQEAIASAASALPVDDPQPEVVHADADFVVTGTFEYGTRTAVIQAITALGGRVASNCSGKTRYLVIGTLGSRDWINSNAGRKIQAAVRLRDESGQPLAIVSEHHWLKHL